jgi:hypothetical protein
MDEVVANCSFQHDYDTQLLEVRIRFQYLYVNPFFIFSSSVHCQFITSATVCIVCFGSFFGKLVDFAATCSEEFY